MKKVQDHYFKKAKREGLVARAAFKLEQIDQRRNLLRKNMRVLDLGCAPGSWLQYAGTKVGTWGGQVVGVDLSPVTGQMGSNVTVIQGDIFELGVEELRAGGADYDVVLSDMAPKTTGVKSADAARSAALVERVLEVAESVLHPGGSVLAKLFQGADMQRLANLFKERFETVTLEKPKASRAESVEIFLLGMGWKGVTGTEDKKEPEGEP